VDERTDSTFVLKRWRSHLGCENSLIISKYISERPSKSRLVGLLAVISSSQYLVFLYSTAFLSDYSRLSTSLHLGHFTPRQLCLFLHKQNFQTSDLSNQHFSCCDSTYTFSSINTSFRPASESEIYKILFDCPNKQSDSDPIPTWLLKKCSSVFIPTITNIVNLSLGQKPAVKLSANL